jgi:hypothetical protein
VHFVDQFLLLRGQIDRVGTYGQTADTYAAGTLLRSRNFRHESPLRASERAANTFY